MKLAIFILMSLFGIVEALMDVDEVRTVRRQVSDVDCPGQVNCTTNAIKTSVEKRRRNRKIMRGDREGDEKHFWSSDSDSDEFEWFDSSSSSSSKSSSNSIDIMDDLWSGAKKVGGGMVDVVVHELTKEDDEFEQTEFIFYPTEDEWDNSTGSSLTIALAMKSGLVLQSTYYILSCLKWFD